MAQAWVVALVIAVSLALWKLHEFGMYEHQCYRCQGKGRHRDDCPLKED